MQSKEHLACREVHRLGIRPEKGGKARLDNVLSNNRGVTGAHWDCNDTSGDMARHSVLGWDERNFIRHRPTQGMRPSELSGLRFTQQPRVV